MNTTARIAVCSRSFSRNPVLRAELLKRYSQVTFNDAGIAFTRDSLVDFLRGHDKAIVALEKVDQSVLLQLPELQVISKYGVGLDMIDVDAMRTNGRRLGWTAGVNRRSVAELVVAFAIMMLREVSIAHREVRLGGWQQHVGRYLSTCTVGIVGCGNIGKDLAVLLRPFGCAVLANDIREFPEFYQSHGIEAVGLDELLRRADIVTLHVPLDDSTRGLFDERRLSLMKRDAVLINTARGGIVDEVALKHLLENGQLGGAAFDVFAVEPPGDASLLALPNFVATPHIGGSAREAILAMGRAAIEGLDRNWIP